MPTPPFLLKISDDLSQGRTRRLKVRTLLAGYGLKRRRAEGISVIRSDMKSLGITTVPDFETIDFDDQVRFVLVGDGSRLSTVVEPDDEPDLFRIESQAGSERAYRVLFKSYDSLERFQQMMKEWRRARSFQNGQNSRREDRDVYPFFLNLELAEQYSKSDMENWLQEASRLESEMPPSGQNFEPPIATASAGPGYDVKQHVTDVIEGLRSELTAQAADLKNALDKKVEEIRFDAIQKLARQIKDDEALALIDEFEAEMRKNLAEKEDDLKSKQNEINLLQSKLADADELLAQAELDGEYDPTDAYPTMDATVRLFQNLCGNDRSVIVHDQAIRSAQRSSCIRRREVLEFLLTLRELGALLYRRGESPGQLREWFAARGYEYAQHDSETTTTRYGTERQITIDGVAVQLEEHVTLFPNTSNCTTIYFIRNNTTHELIVGYVGKHLRTVSR